MPDFWSLFCYYSGCKDTVNSGFQIDTGPLLTSLHVTQFDRALELLDKKPWNGVSEGVWYHNSFKCYALMGVKCLVLDGGSREGKCHHYLLFVVKQERSE